MTELKRSKPGCFTIVGAILVGSLVAAVLLAGVIVLVSLPFMWAWGMFMTPVLGLPLLSFTESLGAVILLGILSLVFRAGARRSSID